ncbi:insulin-like growth factor-binding protein 1 isoform X1 [Takifugu flavidus]|uniref:insulin-like growth factor-binding protein 1 isoform X1 n=1 Tax=Takifugu flavidus TaxID=433684 RepID=UPI0025448404|nr:insulin-like growth factor-binding protein 1 isoform X1 [Takifugu flavidus]
MSGLYERVVAVAAVVSVAVVRSSPVVGPEPIRCAPCSQETLSSCPAVPAECTQVLREPGCGCCMACALEKGASCGVHTAHCGEGLRCTPRPDEARPLHALTRGQGVCTEDSARGSVDTDRPERTKVIKINAMSLCTEDDGSVQYLLSLNLPADHQDTAEGQESIKAKLNAVRNKLVRQGPCHTELHAALDTITSSQQTLGEKFTTFYLPNCDKHGYYKAKQCESSLVGPPARCWCVSSWNGKKIPGSGDLLGDSDCDQEIAH